MAFSIKQHDLRPRYRVQLTQSDPNDPTIQLPADLATATSVKFLMKSSSGTLSVSSPATFVDKPTGVVEYAWQVGDTDTAGDFNIEFEVLWGTEPQTFPSDGYFTCKINPDLG